MQSTPLDNQQLASLLDHLQQSLLRHELDDQGIEQLSHYSGTHQHQLMKLLDAVNDFDFNLALQLLAQLKQQLGGDKL